MWKLKRSDQLGNLFLSTGGCEQTNNTDKGVRVILSVPRVNRGEVSTDKRRPAVALGVLAIGAVSVIRDHVPWRRG